MANKSGVTRDYYNKLTGCAYSFSGINNIIDPSNLDLSTGRVADAINVDFDNTNSASRRDGFSLAYSGSFHSAWNNEQKTTAYMISGGWIYEFDGTSAPYPIIELSNDQTCEFCQVNDIVVYSNGTDFGVIGGNNRQQRTYSEEFKAATLGGRCLEFYNGRLYFSRNGSLHCTDTFDVEHVDVRFNHVATFPHSITMCKRVEDGLWVGTEKYVYFLKGDDIREQGFEQIIAAKAGVVYGSAVKTNAEYIPEAKATNNLVLFLTTQGICSGGNSGSFVNHSFNEVSFDVGAKGSATLHNKAGASYYIVSFDVDSKYEYNPYTHSIDIEVNTI